MSSSKPLAGITVVEIGHSIAAPYAGMILGELGAEGPDPAVAVRLEDDHDPARTGVAGRLQDGVAQRLAAWGEGGSAAIAAGLRAVAPATGIAAAAVTGVLLADLLLLAVIVYGYRRLRPVLSVYLARGSRS